MDRDTVVRTTIATLRRLALPATALVLGAATLAAQAPNQSPKELLSEFSQSWNEKAWTKKSRRRPSGYMRSLDDQGWRVRMLVLQGLIRRSQEAVPVLAKALKSGDAPQRTLAAQALGYLAPYAPQQLLLDSAKNDKAPPVRLYAVDALGMKGMRAGEIDWNELRKTESNGDIRKHIGYAIQRRGKPVDKRVIETLKRWDASKVGSAVVGKPAPDFELAAATGETVRLSQFRGKKSVVLVFIYGDT